MKSTVLFILHMPPPVHGAAMMGKYLHDSQIINDTFDCHYINLATAKNLEDIGKVRIAKLWQFLMLLKTIIVKVLTIKPDLVYVTPNAKGGAFLKDFIVVSSLKVFKCKVVLHYHNQGVSQMMNHSLYNFLYKRFFAKVKVILLGEALYKDVSKYVKKENVFICPNGIPMVGLKGENSRSLPEDKIEERPHLLFLSNLLLAKGIVDLLEACVLLRDKGYSFICDVVGGETSDFTKESFQREIDKRNLSEIVIYHGRKYGDDKEYFFQKASIFVLPTHNECFPLVLLEAMQHELVCVATDEGAIPDIIDIGVTGEIVEKRNPQALSAKLGSLLTDSTRRLEMGKAGYQKYSQMFTLTKFEQQLTILINQLLN